MHLPWKNRYSDKETLLAETGRLGWRGVVHMWFTRFTKRDKTRKLGQQ